jgi:haloacetate dehalogenase
MFEGFRLSTVDTAQASIRVRHGGSGPPLLLLHGSPQTHVMWHLLAPRLAEDFTLIVTDLRGYGDSSKPEGGEDHARYSKRAMALDQVEVMKHFGFEHFALCGHDRGGRVGYRMALDHPGVVTKLAVLDIVPTWEAFSRADMAFGLSYWHWFFLAQLYTCPSACSPPTRRRPSSGAAARLLPPRRWRSTCAASATPRPSTLPARTTGPRPPSTTSTTRKTVKWASA